MHSARGVFFGEKMNKLDAINLMLSRINQAPIATLQGSKTARIIIAENILKDEINAFQMQSYAFNEIEHYTLHPDENGEILLPKNTLKIYPCRECFDGNFYVQRGNRMYNKTRNTYKINRSLEVNIITEMDFEDLPEPAKLYIVKKSANVFVETIKDSQSKVKYTEQEIFEAKQILDEYESDCGNYNILEIYNDKRYLG